MHSSSFFFLPFQVTFILFAEKSRSIDGAQDPPPQIMSPWYVKYFKVKDYDKATEAGRSLCHSHPFFS